jgi:ankyrin repeat protein
MAIEPLINAGINVNAIDINGRTALIYAVVNNYEKIIKVLLKNNVDVNIRDISKNTAFTYASMNKICRNGNIVHLLNQHGASE